MWTPVCVNRWGKEAWRGPGGATKTDPRLKVRAETVISHVGVPPVHSALNFRPAWWGQPTVEWQ